MLKNHSQYTQSPNNTFLSQSKTDTLGLERHVKSVFQQTQLTITSLTNEVEQQKKVNEEMQWKLNDLNQQKQSLTTRNKKLDADLKDCKVHADELLKQKNE